MNLLLLRLDPSSIPGTRSALLLGICVAVLLTGMVPDAALAQDGALVVTEIHCDPRELSDEVGEWIELYNPTDQAIDLRGWSLEDRRFDAHQIRSDDALLVQPGAYVVLARRAEILQGMGLTILYAYGDDFILDDVQDEVLLIDENGVLNDGIAYDRSQDWPGLYGHSMEWLGKGSNQQADNWQNAPYKFFAGDYGSPGTENGVPPLGEAPIETKPRKVRHSEIYAELLRGDLAPESAIKLAELGPPPPDKENLSWVLRFGARVQVSNDVGFLLEVPFAAGNLAVQQQTPGQPTLEWSESSDATLGNPYLGAVFNLWGGNLELETGVHMPIAADSSQVDKKVAALLGMATDYVTGAESFAQDAVPVSLYLRDTDILPTFFFLGGEAAYHLWIPSDQRDKAVSFFQYGVNGGVDIGLLRTGVAAVGRLQTRSGTGDELERDFVHEARLFAEMRLGPFHPGIEYRRPLSSELERLFDAVYLVRLGIELP